MELEFRRRIEMHDSLMRQIEERREKLRQEVEEDARYKEQVFTDYLKQLFNLLIFLFF